MQKGILVGQSGKEERWLIELRSLGISPHSKNLQNDEEELKQLANTIKQSMYEDYKLAYGVSGDKYKEESESTITV